MKIFSRIDLYTGLILLCLVLLPLCGWWCMKTNDEIKLCTTAVRDARRTNGVLEEIGALQKKIEVVRSNRAGETVSRPGVFLQTQLLAAAGNQGLKSTDFDITSPKEEPASIRGSKQKVSDYVVTVQWLRKDLALKLDYIEAMLWNCESGAGQQRGQNSVPSIWRLRQLDIVNVTDEKKFQRFDTPPPELEDRWTIKQLKFARREPKTK